MESNYWLRRTMNRRSILRAGGFGVAGLGAAALVGCGSDSGGGGDSSGTAGSNTVGKFKRGGTIKMGTAALSSGLDPHFSGTGYHKTRLAFDTLLDFDDKGNPMARADALAESFEIVDQKTIVLKLRKGVKFHDGTPFTAESVKWNVARELQPNPPAGTPHKAEIETTERIEAVDANTVRWVLKQPDSGIVTAFTNHSTQMLSPTHYEGKSIADVQWKPVGTGRYMFLDYSADAFIKYQVNKEYFAKASDGGPAGLVDQVWELAIPDPIARATSLINGDIDMLDESPATQLDLLNGDARIEGVKKDGFAIRNAYINHGLKPLDNVEFRRALAWAWDPVAQNKLFDDGIGKVATSALSSLSWAHVDVPTFPSFDLAKAQMHMQRSGIPEADRKVIITGDPLYFQFLQDAWSKIGVKSEHVTSANSTGRLNKNAGVKEPDIHMSVGSRITSRPDPGWQMSAMLRSDAVYNYGWAPTGKIDELLDKERATYDTAARKALHKEIQEIHSDQQYAHILKVEIPFWVHWRKGISGLGHFATGRGDYRNVHFTA